jgi:hypothetical protein
MGGTKAGTMRSANRTMVKSPPELWELIDQPERMQGLMSSLLGRATEVKVFGREPESYLGWETREGDPTAWIEVELSESGWGTKVVVKAENRDEARLDKWLEAVMEELSAPEKRPFDGIV